MSLIRLREFGQALGRLTDDADTSVSWAHRLGEQWGGFQSLMQRRGTAAALVRPDARGLPVRYRVVAHTKADLVGVDDETGERIPLGFDEAQLLGIDWRKVVAGLRSGLRLQGPWQEVTGHRRVWELGRYALTDTRTASVYLAAPPRPRLASALDRLLAEGVREAVVLVPDTQAIDAAVVVRLRSASVLVAGMADCLALDDSGDLVGVAGPESVFGDLRALLGLAPIACDPFQMIRNGDRWDLVFRGDGFSVANTTGVGLHAIAMLLTAGPDPVPAIDIQASYRQVDRRLLTGSKGPKADSATQSQVRRRMEKLAGRIQRNSQDHPDYDQWEAELDRLLAYAQDTEGFAGAESQTATPRAAGRAVGNAIKAAIKAIADTGGPGAAMAAHLRESIQSPTGQRPVYRSGAECITWLIETG
jgi:hypothetical protein